MSERPIRYEQPLEVEYTPQDPDDAQAAIKLMGATLVLLASFDYPDTLELRTRQPPRRPPYDVAYVPPEMKPLFKAEVIERGVLPSYRCTTHLPRWSRQVTNTTYHATYNLHPAAPDLVGGTVEVTKVGRTAWVKEEQKPRTPERYSTANNSLRCLADSIEALRKGYLMTVQYKWFTGNISREES